MITINGIQSSLSENCSLLDCIKSRGYNPEYIVAELNRNIIPKEEYEKTALKDGDVLEILNFVGGG